MDRRTFLGTLTGGLLAAPLAAEAQQAASLPRIGFLMPGAPFLTHESRVAFRPSGKACASWAMWKVRTSPLSSDGRRGSTTGYPASRPSWSVSR